MSVSGTSSGTTSCTCFTGPHPSDSSAPVGHSFPPFLERVTCPHLQAQLRGLDAAILQAMQVTHTALHYTHELMTTFGLIHTLHQSPEQLDGELRPHHRRLFSSVPSPSSPPTTTPMRGYDRPLHRLDSGPNPPLRTPTSSTTRPCGITVVTTHGPHSRCGLV